MKTKRFGLSISKTEYISFNFSKINVGSNPKVKIGNIILQVSLLKYLGSIIQFSFWNHASVAINALDGVLVEGVSLSANLARFPRKIGIDYVVGNSGGKASRLKGMHRPLVPLLGVRGEDGLCFSFYNLCCCCWDPCCNFVFRLRLG